VTEDNRIREIRAVLDEAGHWTSETRPAAGDAKTLRRIRTIMDSAPPAPEPWQMEARIEEQRATSLGYCEHVVEVLSDGEEESCSNLRLRGQVHCEEHAPAPRVFFPGDTVPDGTIVIDGERQISTAYGDHQLENMTCLEVFGIPSFEEWQAAVDRARDARADAAAPPAKARQRTRTTLGGFPYRQHPHDLCGSNVERQQVGDPGHCEDCCSVGHVVAHPDLGCGDVGCYRTHGDSRCRCGVKPGNEHLRNCTERCQDCGGDPDGPRRCRCRASEERANPEPEGTQP